jgi:pSer/pThr/pTyr-binding forkhead associated (FHA) protein
VVTDPNASRRHAEIRRDGNDVVVVDLGSTNGTRVNGAPIRERVLEDGDEIVIGTTFLRFETS